MSTSLDDEPPSLEENDHLLASFSYSMNVLKGETPQYHDGTEDTNTGYFSPSLPFDTPESRISHAQEDDFLPAGPNSTNFCHGGPKNSAVRIFHALCRWVKGPRSPRPFTIKPILPQLQNLPLAFLQRYFPGRQQRSWLLIVIYLL